MPSIPLVGVLTENIWQAVHQTKPLLYGMQRAVKNSKPWKDIPMASVPFVGVPTENIWQAVHGQNRYYMGCKER